MSLKKIFGYIVLLPYFMFWIGFPILEKIIKGFYLNDYPFIGYILLAIAFLGGLLIIFQNFYSRINSLGWYTLGGLVLLASSFLIYIGIFLSGIGF